MSLKAVIGTTRKERKEHLGRITAKVTETLEAPGAEDVVAAVLCVIIKTDGTVTHAGALYGGRPMAAALVSQTEEHLAKLIGATQQAEAARQEMMTGGKRRRYDA